MIAKVPMELKDQCQYQTIKGLRTAADEALSEKAYNLALIRRYSRTAWRWVGAYRKGLDGALA